MNNIIKALEWRYATKKFNQTKKIDNETFEILLEALRLSPSSYGLQPWKFIVVKNEDIRLKIRTVGFDQPQMTEASHLIVFANKKNIDGSLVDEYVDFVSKEKNIEISKLEGLSSMIKGSFSGKSEEGLRSWASRQLYLSLGVLLTSSAVLGVDACPMEGFDSTKVDEILGLDSMGLESKVIVALGYRSEDDKSALSKKVRFPAKDVFIELN